MSLRLLLIEDSPTQLLTITRRLEAEGYDVLAAQSGAEGLAWAYRELPDLIVSDVVMSGINGYQLCRLVKHDPELCHIPVILLTKLDGSVDRFWGIKSGADRYIPKEPGFLNLVKTIREILGETANRPYLRVVGDANHHSMTAEEINGRLHQLLERLLFEATIAEEVRHIGEDIQDLEIIADKLFALLSSILNYAGAALVVNQGQHSDLMLDISQDLAAPEITAYVSKVALQLGLPPLKEEVSQASNIYENTLTQPIDSAGLRLGLLVVIPRQGQAYKPGDQKVLRSICEQLSTVLRLYLSHAQQEANYKRSSSLTK